MSTERDNEFGIKYDNDDLLDPTHPRSPFNKYNWFSPYSIANPGSPHYDRNQAAIAFLAQVTIYGSIAALVAVKLVTRSFPYFSAVCFFGGIPAALAYFYYMTKNCPKGQACIWWAAIFLFLFGIFMIDIVFRMDGKGSGLLYMWDGMSTGKTLMFPE